MTNTDVILLVLGLADEIRKRHTSRGEVLTDRQVADLVNRELLTGQKNIRDWFDSKGLPPPE